MTPKTPTKGKWYHYKYTHGTQTVSTNALWVVDKIANIKKSLKFVVSQLFKIKYIAEFILFSAYSFALSIWGG